MGDHALDYLNETIDFEFEFADQYYSTDNYLSIDMPDREPHPLFDYNGIPTYEDLCDDLRNTTVLLKSNTSLAEYSGCTMNDHIDGTIQLPIEIVNNFKTKYKLKYNMMFGMINSIYDGKELSSKQSKWMDTNWKGVLLPLLKQ